MSDVQKLKIGFGSIQIEYEGDLEILKSNLPELLEVISGYKPVTTTGGHGNHGAASNDDTAPPAGEKIEVTTTTIASKIGCNSGPDLIKAASAQLTLSQGKQKFSRTELLKEMKTSSYHKESYVGNLSKYIGTLIKAGFLNENQKDVYSVHPNEIKKIESQVA